MGMAELERGVAAVADSDLAFFAGPRDASLVAAAEDALGLSLPPTYRRFVSELGAGNAGSREFYGVTTDSFTDASVPNGIWLTLDEREQFDLPKHLVIVGDTGMGEYYALDTSQRDSADESPVVIWMAGRAQEGHALEVVAPDFGSFFLQAIEEEFGPA